MNVYYYKNNPTDSKTMEPEVAHSVNVPTEIKNRLKNDQTVTKSFIASENIEINHSQDKIPESEMKSGMQFFINDPSQLQSLIQQQMQPKLDVETKKRNIFRIVSECSEKVTDYEIPWKSPERTQKASTGFMVKVKKTDGTDFDYYLVTNNHAVIHNVRDQFSKQHVKLFNCNNIKSEATIVAVCMQWDLAVLKPCQKSIAFAKDQADLIDESVIDLKHYKFPRPGSQIVILGHPLNNLNVSIADGIVTANGSQTYALSNYVGPVIGTNAAINPGNSGGPAYDEEGELLGVVFEGIRDENAQNVGFIIPKSLLVVPLMEYHRTKHDSANMDLPVVKLPYREISLSMDEISGEASRRFHRIDETLAREGIQVGPRQIGMRVMGTEEIKRTDGILPEDIVIKMGDHYLNSDGTIIVDESIFDHRVLNVNLTAENPKMTIQLLRKEDKEMKLLTKEIDASGSCSLMENHPTEEPQEYLQLFGMTLYPLGIKIVAESMQNNRVSVDMLKCVAEMKSDPRKQAIFVYNVRPDEKSTPFTKIAMKQVEKINNYEVQNISDAIFAANLPLVDDDGNQLLRILTTDKHEVIVGFNDFKAEIKDYMARNNVKGHGFYSTELSKYLGKCGCVQQELKFDETKIACCNCNKPLTMIKKENSVLSFVDPEKPQAIDLQPNSIKGMPTETLPKQPIIKRSSGAMGNFPFERLAPAAA